METIIAFSIGILFLTYGIFDFFVQSKAPKIVRFIIRFIIISIGIGFILYAAIRVLELGTT